MRTPIVVHNALIPAGDIEIGEWTEELDCFGLFVLFQSRVHYVVLETTIDRFAEELQSWIDAMLPLRAEVTGVPLPSGRPPRVDGDKLAHALRQLAIDGDNGEIGLGFNLRREDTDLYRSHPSVRGAPPLAAP